MIDGLGPYPAMKDSGVPWLGEVPAHWEVLSIGGLGTLFKGNGGSKADEVSQGVPCVRYGDLYTRHEFFIEACRSFVTEVRSQAYTQIAHGDVLFAASGETIDDIGRSAVNLLNRKAVCGGDVIVLRPRREVVARFLGYATNSFGAAWQKARFGKGFTVVHIYGSDIKRILLPLPPLDEQRAIARFLDHADRLIRRYAGTEALSWRRATATSRLGLAGRTVMLLAEYRTGLIFDTVTGKLDVRTAAAVLPEMAEKEPEVLEAAGGTKESEPNEEGFEEKAEATA